jgi:hypothetical protein
MQASTLIAKIFLYIPKRSVWGKMYHYFLSIEVMEDSNLSKTRKELNHYFYYMRLRQYTYQFDHNTFYARLLGIPKHDNHIRLSKLPQQGFYCDRDSSELFLNHSERGGKIIAAEFNSIKLDYCLEIYLNSSLINNRERRWTLEFQKSFIHIIIHCWWIISSELFYSIIIWLMI